MYKFYRKWNIFFYFTLILWILGLIKGTDYWHALFELPQINLQMAPLCLEVYCGISALDLSWKETISWTKLYCMFLCGLISATDLVEPSKLISHVAQIKFQGRSLEMKSQNINPLYIVVPCCISVTVSQLNCHLYEMKEGHEVLPGGNWNVTFLYHAKLFQLWSHNIIILQDHSV